MNNEKNHNNLVDGKYSIKDLVDIKELKRIFEKFSELTGSTIGFVSYPDQEVILGINWRDICTKFHRFNPESAKACLKSNISMTGKAKKVGDIVVEPCDNGLVDGGTPVIIKGKHIATLATGQVFFEQPDLERFKKQAELYGYDVNEYLESVKEVPVISESEFRKTLSLLGDIAVLIAEMGYANLEAKERNKQLSDEVGLRKQVEGALQKINKQIEIYKLMVDFTGDGVYKYSFDDGKIIFANRGLVKILDLNCPPEELVGKDLKDVLIYIEKPGTIRDAVLKYGDIHGLEYHFKTLKGDDRYVIHDSFLSNDPDTGKKVVEAIVKDITERKKIEIKMKRLNRNLLTISQCNQVLVRSSNEVDLLRHVCQIIVGIGGYDFSWVGLLKEPEERFVEAVTLAGGKDIKIESIKVDLEDVDLDSDPVVSAMRSGRASVYNNFKNKPAYLKEIDKQGYLSAISLPLTINFKSIGVLNIYSSEPNVFDEDEIGLLEELTSDLSFGLLSLQVREEHRKMEEEINKSAKEWQVTFNSTQDIVMLIDKESKIVKANTSLSEFLNLPLKDIIGKTCFQLMHNASLHIPGCPLVKSIESKEHEELELYLPDKKKWLLISVDPILDENMLFTGAVHIIKDITLSKKMFEMLNESEKRFREIFDNSSDGMLIARIHDKKIALGNKAIEKMLGYTQEEIRNFTVHDLHTKEYAPEAIKLFGKLAEGKAQFVYNVPMKRKDGSILYVDILGSRTTLNGEEYLRGIFRDATERKKSEKELFESEMRYRRLFESTKDGIMIVAASGEIIDVNPYLLEDLGYSFRDFIGKLIWEIRTFKGLIKSKEAFKLFLQKGSVNYENLPLTTKDGRVIYVEVVSNSYKSGEGVVAQFNIRDVTQRKTVEDQLKRSEENFRFLVEGVKDYSIIMLDPQGYVTSWNEGVLRIIGYSREDIIGKHVAHLYTKDDVIKNKPERDLAEAKKNDICTYEGWQLRKNGSRFWSYNVTTAIRNEAGYLTGYSRITRDITSIKVAEDQLRLERDKAQHYLDVAEVMIVVLNPSGIVTLINRKGCSLLGLSQDEILGVNWFDRFVPKSDRIKVKKAFKKLKSGSEKAVEYFENKILTKSGEERLIAWHNIIIRDEEGNFISSLSSGEDITDRKKVEQEQEKLTSELMQANKKFQELSIKDSHTGLYNHRFLSEALDKELMRADRFGQSLSVLMIDIDYFKSVNDVYGHEFGDLILRQFAVFLKKIVRKYDIVVRFGGEEFVIVCPALDKAGSFPFAKRLLDSVSLANFGDKKRLVKIKVSIGFATYPQDSIGSEKDIFSLVDKILNKAKEDGGNRAYSLRDIKLKRIITPSTQPVSQDALYLKEKINKLTKRTNQSLVEAVVAFARTIEAKDHYTGSHVEMTVKYATEIASKLELSKEEIENIEQAATLHDLGKIGIPENILLKKGKLTREEYEIIKRHPQIGADIIRPIQSLRDIVPIVLYHHERWDGKGYPFGLKGKEIPIGARIIAIADVYQALTSNRPYRKAFPRKVAISMVKEGAGTQFDPAIVAVLLSILKVH